MQDVAIKAFKNELSNYRFYQRRLKSLENMIEYCYDMLGGVRAVDPSKEPTHAFVPNKDREYAIRDEIARHERNKALVEAKLKYLDEILGQIETPLKEALIAIFADRRKTLIKVASEMYMSESTLRRTLNRAIKKALVD